MKTTRLYEVISSLDKSEFRKLEEFLISPFVNKNKQILSFYYFLSSKNIHPDYSKINREDIFNYVYTGQNFDLNKYLKLSSDFVKALEKFLIHEFRNRNTLSDKRIILEISRQKNLNKTFEKYINEIDNSGKKDFNKDLDYYLMEYEAKGEAMLFNLGKGKFDLNKALYDINDTFDVLYINNKLELLIKLQSLSYEKENKRIWLKDEILNYVESNQKFFKEKHLLIYMKVLILKMFTDSEEKFYEELKSLLNLNRKKFNSENQIYLYDKLLSYCTMMNTDEYKAEEFGILKNMEDNSLLFPDNDLIDYRYFLNVIECALNENDPFWADNIIKKYKRRLFPEISECTINLAEASVNIYNSKYIQAMENLNLITSNEEFFYLSTKIMSIIVFYELDEEKSIYYNIEALRNYFSRRNDSKKTDYTYHKKFLIYLKKLLTLRSKEKIKKSEVAGLLNDIEKEDSLANKEWLIRKVKLI